MVTVVQFPPEGRKSSVSQAAADRDLRWAVFRLVQAYGPKAALIRLEDAAARLKENLT
jgi:hypothetical protein